MIISFRKSSCQVICQLFPNAHKAAYDTSSSQFLSDWHKALPAPVSDYQYMADPHRLFHIRKLTGHCQDILVGLPGKLSVLLLIDLFDIQKHQICIFHQLQPLGMPGLFCCIRIATGFSLAVLLRQPLPF